MDQVAMSNKCTWNGSVPASGAECQRRDRWRVVAALGGGEARSMRSKLACNAPMLPGESC